MWETWFKSIYSKQKYEIAEKIIPTVAGTSDGTEEDSFIYDME